MKVSEAKKLAAELSSDLPRLDLHGLRLAEGEIKVDQFLYSEGKKGENIVEIVYGIGEGVMRKKILDFVRSHPLVEEVFEEPAVCRVFLFKIS